MRHLILDTETTGLSFIDGDRVIEIAAVEYIDGRPTGNSFYTLLNPERDIPADATEVHGITNERVRDQPKFREVAGKFVDYIRGAKLIAHNASFDVGMLDNELAMAGFQERLADITEEITDSLRIARGLYPKAKNDLDSLLSRLGIDASARNDGHNARVDCALLGEVFFKMTDGVDLSLLNLSNPPPRARIQPVSRPASLPRVEVPAHELDQEAQVLEKIQASGVEPVARRVGMRR